MKAEELRIGNLVYYHVDDKYEGEYDMVETIDYDDIRVIAINGDESYKPIPLTEEWLLKFGFKFIDRDISHGNGKIERFYISPKFGEHREYWFEIQLAKDINDEFGCSFMWLNWNIGGGNKFIHMPYGHKMFYVHQLQNLYFALTENELTICDQD